MIKSFRDKWLRYFFLEDKPSKKIPADIRERLFRKLQLADDATCRKDLMSPPSNHFERLSGNLSGLCSIRVNNQWRLVFEWDDEHGEARGLYLDNHDYR
ncbi:MAG TPA: type II toxin-antitoxin system RelE/ParE family toxin [Sedimenticola sp.]|nr:type II toxin-antitoxin system RelE/ParE family toxin [Sedimenticola sp.]